MLSKMFHRMCFLYLQILAVQINIFSRNGYVQKTTTFFVGDFPQMVQKVVTYYIVMTHYVVRDLMIKHSAVESRVRPRNNPEVRYLIMNHCAVVLR